VAAASHHPSDLTRDLGIPDHAPKSLFSRRVIDRLLVPVDAASLIVFRFLLGALVVASVVRQWAKGAIYDSFVAPTHFFPYFDAIRPLPGNGMYFVYIAIGIAGLALALGFRTRIAAAVACVLFTYAHLADKSNYLNHYYLISLLLGLVALLDISNRDRELPAWMLWIVRFQIALVYFYGGIGKLNADWLLRAEPLSTWLAANGDFPLLGPILTIPATAYVMSWLGAAFDLSVAFLLCMRRTRLIAYVAVVLFHVVTARLFQIGIFPWLMIALTLIFFEPSWPRRLLLKLKLPQSSTSKTSRSRHRRPLLPIAIAWATIQALLPLRSHLFTNDVLWTEDGYRFSWRVMLMEKAGSAELTAVSPSTGEAREIRARDYLTPFQVKMMSTQPDMLHDFARMLADDAVAASGAHERPIIRGDVVVTLNGSVPHRLVDPKADLAASPPRSFVLAR
jgi:vitamin K-dependent gamma-carboxylase